MKRALAEVGAPETPDDWIYFAQAEHGPVKIGRARRIYHRISALQVGSPVRLRLVGFMRAESPVHEGDLHHRFREHHVRGEWFHPAPSLAAFVAAIDLDAQREAHAALLSKSRVHFAETRLETAR